MFADLQHRLCVPYVIDLLLHHPLSVMLESPRSVDSFITHSLLGIMRHGRLFTHSIYWVTYVHRFTTPLFSHFAPPFSENCVSTVCQVLVALQHLLVCVSCGLFDTVQ
jgi:hypothetical protein